MEPKKFKVYSHGSSGITSKWVNTLDEQRSCTPIEMAIPPEFDGPGGTFSPEDLYLLSLVNCFLATYKYVAEKSKIEFMEIQGKGILHVEKGNENSLWMSRAELSFTVIGPKQRDRVLNLLEKTKRNCMIINSVKTNVTFSFTVLD
jgi:organic hydroperoxide reductase OsmC/OhrA